jgi:hypothetical protein
MGNKLIGGIRRPMTQSKQSEFTMKSMLAMFAKDDIAKHFKLDSLMKLRISIYIGYFFIFAVCSKFLFNMRFSAANIILFFGVFSGVFVRNTCKKFMNKDAATMTGIVVTMVFVMISVILRIIF